MQCMRVMLACAQPGKTQQGQLKIFDQFERMDRKLYLDTTRSFSFFFYFAFAQFSNAFYSLKLLTFSDIETFLRIFCVIGSKTCMHEIVLRRTCPIIISVLPLWDNGTHIDLVLFTVGHQNVWLFAGATLHIHRVRPLSFFVDLYADYAKEKRGNCRMWKPNKLGYCIVVLVVFFAWQVV